MSAGRAQPWDQQPGETPPAWQAFVVYRDLGLERSLAAAAEKLGKSKRLLQRWSSEHSWRTRTQAYDAEQDRWHQVRLRSERQKAFGRNLAILDKAKTKVESEIESAKTDLVKLMDVTLKHDRLLLEDQQAGARQAGVSPEDAEHLESLEGLTDEQMLLRLFELRESVTKDLHDAAEDWGVSLEALEGKLREELSADRQW